jgi:hypothetical protein
MKKLVLFLAVTVLSFAPADTSLTADERKAAVEKLTQTQDHMLKTLKGLSPAQLNYKADAGSWSIAECAEHIAISEGLIWGMVDTALKQPADPSKRGDVKMSDEQLFNMITDRSNKIKTQEVFEPKNKFASLEGSIKEFKQKRAAHIDFVKTTKEDLRDRYAALKFGTIDAYQAILFMAGHTERHVKQMEEVKANAGFPKK